MSENELNNFESGLDFLTASKFKEARECFEKELSHATENYQVYGYLAFACHLLGENDEALQYSNIAIENCLEKGFAYYVRSCVYINNKMYSEAIMDLTEAIKTEPNNPELFLMRGQCYQKKGDIDLAKNDWLKVVDFGFESAYDLIDKYCK